MGRKHKKKNENDKEYKGRSSTEMKRYRKKKSQKEVRKGKEGQKSQKEEKNAIVTKKCATSQL